MKRIAILALVLQLSLPVWATTGATLQGTVTIPCDPSRVGDVISVMIRPVSGGAPTSVVVDPGTGKFESSGLAAGRYELVAIGPDGRPLSPEPKKLELVDGPNQVVLSMEPPGCGEDAPNRPRARRELKDWHYTVIYFGVVGAIVAVVSSDDEDPASAF